MKISIMQKIKNILKKISVVIFWLAFWHIAVTVANGGLIIDMPTPITTLKALVRLSSNANFYFAAAMSFLRVILGFLMSVLVGVLGAFLSNKSKLFSSLCSPVLRLMRAVPVAAFIFLVFLWVKTEYIPQLIAFLTVVPIIWENTQKALCSVDEKLLEMAEVLKLSKTKKLAFIVFPSIKPAFSASLITGLGFAWKSAVAAEVICRCAHSLGNLLWVGKNSIDYDEVFAVTVVVVVFSVLLETLLKLLLKGAKAND